MKNTLIISSLLVAAAMFSATTGQAQQSRSGNGWDAYFNFLNNRINDRLNRLNQPNRSANQQFNGGGTQQFNGGGTQQVNHGGNTNRQNQSFNQSSSQSNQIVVQQLQNLLHNQARFGQHPGNNALLAQVKSLVDRNTVVTSAPQIRVKNEGTGVVTITPLNGRPIYLYGGMEAPVNVGAPVLIQASINTPIRVTHLGNGNCDFWDQSNGTQTVLGTGWNATNSYPVMLRNNQTYSVTKS